MKNRVLATLAVLASAWLFLQSSQIGLVAESYNGLETFVAWGRFVLYALGGGFLLLASWLVNKKQ